MHEQPPAFCSICNGRDARDKRTTRVPKAPAAPKAPRATKAAATPSKRLTTRVVATTSADTEESVEEHRSHYAGDRAATFDAYVEVFFNTEARNFPGGWLSFSRCANGDPERRATAPALVLRAERLMRDAGYEPDGGLVGARNWRYEG